MTVAAEKVKTPGELLFDEFLENKKKVAKLKSQIVTTLIKTHGVKEVIIDPIPYGKQPMGMKIILGNGKLLEFISCGTTVDGPWLEDNLKETVSSPKLTALTKRQSELFKTLGL